MHTPQKEIQFKIILFYVIGRFSIVQIDMTILEILLRLLLFLFSHYMKYISRLFDVQIDLKSMIIERNDDALT